MDDLPELTCDLYDAHADVAQTCDVQFRSFGARGRFRGEIVTLEAFEDNRLEGEILAEDGRGRVLVVEAGGRTRTSMLGGNLAALAVASGWEGLVIHGAVRDSAELATRDLGIKALGVTPRRSNKSGTGRRDVMINFGGCSFVPGWRLFADEDGIVVLPPTE